MDRALHSWDPLGRFLGSIWDLFGIPLVVAQLAPQAVREAFKPSSWDLARWVGSCTRETGWVTAGDHSLPYGPLLAKGSQGSQEIAKPLLEAGVSSWDPPPKWDPKSGVGSQEIRDWTRRDATRGASELPLTLSRAPARLLLARSFEVRCRAACAAAWPRYRLSLVLTAWRSMAVVELRAASGRMLDRARRPGRALPGFGDAVGWHLYRAACWWTFRRRQGCAGCGGLTCVCDELAAAESEQLELTTWLAGRGCS